MKLTFATLTAAATFAATSAFALATPEDKALNEALRSGEIAPIAQADYVKAQSPITGRASIADADGYVFLTEVDNADYNEAASVGRR